MLLDRIPLGLIPTIIDEFKDGGSLAFAYSEATRNFFQNLFSSIPKLIIPTNLPNSLGSFFVGREKELHVIQNSLEQPQKLIVLRGSGGTGKSQLACEYAHQYQAQQKYDLIRWLKADSKENFEKGLMEFADDLSVDKNLEKPVRLRLLLLKVLQYLSVLLIFDNVESLGSLVLNNPARLFNVVANEG